MAACLRPWIEVDYETMHQCPEYIMTQRHEKDIRSHLSITVILVRHPSCGICDRAAFEHTPKLTNFSISPSNHSLIALLRIDSPFFLEPRMPQRISCRYPTSWVPFEHLDENIVPLRRV